MRRRTFLPLAICVVALAISGCGSQEGETVMTAGPNSPDNIGKAPYTGTYLLFTAASPNPTLTENLKEGVTLGFRKSPEGQIQAVYGDKSYTLPKGTAQVYWKVKK
jgi:phosphotransferase system IIB component